ncbi:MAG: AAA family ATPase [Sphingopyxis sp.]|nr:AAA family ATPase [Sphingopyxis sp.]
MDKAFQLVFIHGPVASGKLTIAKELAAHTGLPLFHNHLVVDTLLSVFPFGSEAFLRLREAMWNQVFDAALAERRSLIFTFAPERTVSPDFPARLAARMAAGGGRVDFVAIICPPDVQRARMENASRQASGKLSSAALFDQLAADGAFDYPALPPAAVTVDSGRMAPEEAARAIVEVLGLDCKGEKT